MRHVYHERLPLFVELDCVSAVTGQRSTASFRDLCISLSCLSFFLIAEPCQAAIMFDGPFLFSLPSVSASDVNAIPSLVVGSRFGAGLDLEI